VKYAWIKANCEQFSIQRTCQMLEVLRTGFQQWLLRGPSSRQAQRQCLDVEVRAWHEASHRADGRPRLVRALKNLGINVGHE
jgi:putative transposase